MTRKIAACPTPPQDRNAWRGLDRLEYDITLVTPMFGGGVIPGEADPVTLIRPPTIRGQLRFWWRACRGAGFTEPPDLHQREVGVWGDTEHPSPIIVEVSLRDKGRVEPCPRSRPGYPAYALFPFQSAERGIGKGVHDARFMLRFTFPAEVKDDLEASIWAWMNFGGIGARTRRGCGALWCAQVSPPDANRTDILEWLKESCAKHKATGPTIPPLWAKLGRFWIGPKSSSPFEVWNDIIRLLRDFRQGPGTGRNPGTEANRPGRSRWPEAESIRNATRCRSRRHQSANQMPNEAFPRAEFGMPIVFHFKDGPRKDSRLSSRELAPLDPTDTEIHPTVGENPKTRMASPLILKPLAIDPDQAFPLILLLNAPRPSAVQLVSDAASIGTFPRTSICNAEFATYPNSPMGPPRAGMAARSNDGSAIEAFLAYAGENGYKEVEL
ncbi:MAG: type III-B CRISPR module RAMP protein Cmr1 [Acidobacteriia bacterium]|nr:type III-B CRISPR module RAMP protein Cmr1 [Terriglobia bacterium]